jgi:tRNA modification GTPase
MDYLSLKDSIAALSTPHAEGAIAIIRLSGNDAIDIVSKIYSGPIKTYKSHTIHYGNILDKNKQIIDHVLLLIMLAPNSYTKENIVEIHCHGSLIIAKKILERILENGARAALPGEFTFRAFNNKKLDLLQAEAIKDLIAAKNELALKFASSQLDGKLSFKIKKIQDELINIAAFFEASLDFPDDDDFGTRMQHISSLEAILKEINEFILTFNNGQKLNSDLSLCIIGSPNVGKSTLMNLLLGKQRAIVTPIAGTTRDILEETMLLNKLSFKLIDTAGIRTTKKTIEQEGIKRAKESFKKADFTLLVLDSSRPLNNVDKQLLKQIDEKSTLVIWNKIDLQKPTTQLNIPNIISISAAHDSSLPSLCDAIEKMVLKITLPTTDEIIITNVRHKNCLQEAYNYGIKAMHNLKENISLELVLADLKASLNSLNGIIGIDVTEDILEKIFSQFCIGK